MPAGFFLTPKSRSPAKNATKPSKAKPKPPAKKAATPKKTPAATKWRVASPAEIQKPAWPVPKAEGPRELTPKEQRFVEEYLVDLNATQAYMRSHPGVKVSTGGTEGMRLLRNPQVQSAIDNSRVEVSRKTGITAERALAEAWAVATADPRDLIEYVIGSCRSCHPSFDPRRDPNPECQECFGKGWGRAMVKDTRKLSPAALALFAGIKQTKDGLEVKMHSKLDALEKVFKHLGLYEKDNNQKVDPIATLLATMAKSSVPVVKAPQEGDDG